MEASSRQYNRTSDYEKVGEFLCRTYRTAGGHINWLQPRWEYMHFHPYIKEVALDRIGVWETNGEIVGVVHQEHRLGTAYFEINPEFNALKTDMLKYAEENLCSESDGVKRLSSALGEMGWAAWSKYLLCNRGTNVRECLIS